MRFQRARGTSAVKFVQCDQHSAFHMQTPIMLLCVLLCFIEPILRNRYVRSRSFIVSEPREMHPRSEIAESQGIFSSMHRICHSHTIIHLQTRPLSTLAHILLHPHNITLTAFLLLKSHTSIGLPCCSQFSAVTAWHSGNTFSRVTP